MIMIINIIKIMLMLLLMIKIIIIIIIIIVVVAAIIVVVVVALDSTQATFFKTLHNILANLIQLDKEYEQK